MTFQKVPMLALTATATSETRDYITDNLCLFNPVIISTTPERSNIKYNVVTVSTRDPKSFLRPIIEDLEENLYSAQRVLIFCRLMIDARKIYKCLLSHFKKKFTSYTNTPFARFHRKTDQVIKDFVIADFSKVNGIVRVLVATIAFGMGVDCQGLHQIIHFGPPAALDDYFQESGRAGRDGLPSQATLVIYPKCLGSKNITKPVKEYSKNTTICRRILLLREFGEEKQEIHPPHMCCDICSEKCTCEACGELEGPLTVTQQGNLLKDKYCLSPAGEDILRTKLLEMKNSLQICQGHCGPALNSGFPLCAVNEIIAIASPDITRAELVRNTSILNDEIYDEIIKVVNDICSDSMFVVYTDASDEDTSDNNSDSHNDDKDVESDKHDGDDNDDIDDGDDDDDGDDVKTSYRANIVFQYESDF